MQPKSRKLCRRRVGWSHHCKVSQCSFAIQHIKIICGTWLSIIAAQHKGSIHRPLINIPLDHIIVDELHFFLRVFDVLLRNLILLAILKDKELRGRNGTHLQNLVNIIKSCGVSFDVWESETSTGCHKWTSLTGESKKKVLKVLILSR